MRGQLSREGRTRGGELGREGRGGKKRGQVRWGSLACELLARRILAKARQVFSPCRELGLRLRHAVRGEEQAEESH